MGNLLHQTDGVDWHVYYNISQQHDIAEVLYLIYFLSSIHILPLGAKAYCKVVIQ